MTDYRVMAIEAGERFCFFVRSAKKGEDLREALQCEAAGWGAEMTSFSKVAPVEVVKWKKKANGKEGESTAKQWKNFLKKGGRAEDYEVEVVLEAPETPGICDIDEADKKVA